MIGSSGDSRALRRMVEELRAESPPELDWQAVERRLMTEITRRTARHGASHTSAFGRVVGFAAAAAMLVFGAASIGSSGRLGDAAAMVPSRLVDATGVALVSGEAGARGERDLSALRVGDAIETGEAPVAFGREGVVVWTLAPASRVVVRSIGDDGVGNTVALERGSIRAEVTPRDASEGLVEAFAVEVDRTRVAVHGTAFSVTRVGDRAEVDVEHGSVAVGPTGHVGVTTGRLLIGPARASFSLDGGSVARFLEPVALRVASVRAAPPAAPASVVAAPAVPTDAARALPGVATGARAVVAAPVAANGVPPAVADAVPAAAPAVATLTSGIVAARLTECFEKVRRGGAHGVVVSFASTLRVVVNDDGSVRAARFEPPLAPDLHGCGAGVFAGRFAEGKREIAIPVSSP